MKYTLTLLDFVISKNELTFEDTAVWRDIKINQYVELIAIIQMCFRH